MFKDIHLIGKSKEDERKEKNKMKVHQYKVQFNFDITLFMILNEFNRFLCTY